MNYYDRSIGMTGSLGNSSRETSLRLFGVSGFCGSVDVGRDPNFGSSGTFSRPSVPKENQQCAN